MFLKTCSQDLDDIYEKEMNSLGLQNKCNGAIICDCAIKYVSVSYLIPLVKLTSMDEKCHQL